MYSLSNSLAQRSFEVVPEAQSDQRRFMQKTMESAKNKVILEGDSKAEVDLSTVTQGALYSYEVCHNGLGPENIRTVTQGALYSYEVCHNWLGPESIRTGKY